MSISGQVDNTDYLNVWLISEGETLTILILSNGGLLTKMWLRIFLFVTGLGIVGLIGIFIFNQVRLNRANAKLVEELLAEASPDTERVFKKEDLEGLPPPVERYLATVLMEGQPYVRSVRLQQSGEFRLGDATSPWKPLRATQYFTIDPPGFVWDATIEMVPLLSVRVVDMYKNGEGSLRAKLFSTISVADEGPGVEMNSGELMRYLAETVWFPTALLPGAGVEWTPIDNESARATLAHRGTSVSLVFYFNSRNEVAHVSAESRYREVDGTFEPTPWTGHFHNYQVRNGLLIPIDAEVEWNLPVGNLSYWRGHLDEIEHEPSR
jgi:hypothetical protein